MLTDDSGDCGLGSILPVQADRALQAADGTAGPFVRDGWTTPADRNSHQQVR